MKILFLIAFLLCSYSVFAASLEDKAAAAVWSGWGDGGTLAVDSETKDIPSPSGNPACLHIDWKDNPDSELTFWALGRGLDIEDFDGFSFDMYVKEADEGSSFALFGNEKDGDRWVYSCDLSQKGKWIHIDCPLDKLAFAPLGKNTKESNTITEFHIEPGGKGCHIDIYFANLNIRQKDGKEINLLSADSIALNYSKPLKGNWKQNTLSPKGKAFIASDIRSWGDGENIDLAKSLSKLFPSSAVSYVGMINDSAGLFNSKLINNKISIMAEQQDGWDFGTELTLKQAWGVRWDGASNNITPGAFDTGHTACLNHPDYLEMQKRRIKAAADAGIKIFTWVDYITAYFGGRWGYAPADIEAYRKALSETDGGLDIVEKGKIKNITFWDYYEDYTGIKPTPKEAGFNSWGEYVPVNEPDKVFERTKEERLCHNIFLALCHYSWLKLLNETGNYYTSLNGGKMWLIPNPEDVYDGADYIYACRLAGVGGILCEYFGNPGWLDAIYYSGPYFRYNTDQSESLLGPVLETNAGGHGLPYYDPWVSYIAAYDLYSAMGATVTKNDFMEGDSFEKMTDPANKYEYARFADMAVKQFAFDNYKTDNAKKPETKTAIIGGRNINRLRSSLFHSLETSGNTREGSPSLAMNELGLDFDTVDESVFAPWDKYSMIFTGIGDINSKAADRLALWAKKKGNILVMTSSQPFARADGIHYSNWVNEDINRIDDWTLGKQFGIENPKETEIKEGIITKSESIFASVFPKGTKLPNAVKGVISVSGRVLLEADGVPLVTVRDFGKGKVFYVGYNAGEPEIMETDKLLFGALAKWAGCKTIAEANNAMCHVYNTKEGYTACIWNRNRINNYDFVYDGNRSQTLELKTEGEAEAKIKVPEGNYLIYYVTDGRTEKQKGQEIKLKITDKTCDICYILPDTEKGQRKINSLKTSMLYKVIEGKISVK